MNRAKNRVTRIAVLVMAIIMCFAMTTVSALGYSYSTDSYDVDVVVKEDNTYTIEEKISVNFFEHKHGIYRYIPMGNYEDMGYMKINHVDVKDWNYEDYTEDSNMVIQIGDADETVYGKQQYDISYRME